MGIGYRSAILMVASTPASVGSTAVTCDGFTAIGYVGVPVQTSDVGRSTFSVY